MKAKDLISLEQFCTSHQIEVTFVNTLQDYGLIEITTIKQAPYISENQLRALEKMMRMHYEMDINIEGIEAIIHLLQRVDDLHEELSGLRNRLGRYED